MKIALGNDHAGLELKNKLFFYLNKNHNCKDFGTYTPESCDFPDYAREVCEAVSTKEYERGILVCSTGTGMTVAANKFKNIVATNIYSSSPESLEVIVHDRKHLDSNVLCLGAKYLEIAFSYSIINLWLRTEFEGNKPDGERFVRRMNKIKEIEKL